MYIATKVDAAGLSDEQIGAIQEKLDELEKQLFKTGTRNIPEWLAELDTLVRNSKLNVLKKLGWEHEAYTPSVDNMSKTFEGNRLICSIDNALAIEQFLRVRQQADAIVNTVQQIKLGTH